MKPVLAVALAVSLAMTTGMAMAVEENNTASLVAKCKSEAASEEVPASELSQFMAQCLQDYGVPEAEATKASSNVGSMPKKEDD